MRLKLGILLVSLVVSLLVAEAALRLAHPRWVIPYPPRCFWPDVYQRFDAHGYRLWPSRTMQAPQAPRTVSLVSNADGFCNRREFGEADGRTRIVVLGDSMVFGSGVEAAERFSGSPRRSRRWNQAGASTISA